MTDPATFAALWGRAVRHHGERVFLVFRREDGAVDSWTCAAFDGVVDRVAVSLRARGVGTGRAVHLVLRNSPAFVAVDDPVRDRVPAAYVVPRDPARPPAAEELAAWADDNLSPAARPRTWTLIDALPRTSVARSGGSVSPVPGGQRMTSLTTGE